MSESSSLSELIGTVPDEPAVDDRIWTAKEHVGQLHLFITQGKEDGEYVPEDGDPVPTIILKHVVVFHSKEEGGIKIYCYRDVVVRNKHVRIALSHPVAIKAILRYEDNGTWGTYKLEASDTSPGSQDDKIIDKFIDQYVRETDEGSIVINYKGSASKPSRNKPRMTSQ